MTYVRHLLALSLTLLTSLIFAQQITPEMALERLLTSQLEEAWFTDEILAQVTLEQLDAIITQQTAELGVLEGVTGEGTEFVATFEEGTLPTTLTLDPQGRIAGIFFRPAIPRVSDLEDALSRFDDLTGEVSVLVLEDGNARAERNADEPLAVGSTFKLAVLAALQEQIAAGERAWDEVVMLAPEDKSLPSGILQDWPDGSPLTLETLATLMISISDNTATDVLIRAVGREAVEAFSERNRPLLTTHEFFVLKNPANDDLLERYRDGDEDARRELLAELPERPLPTASAFAAGPLATDIEWFFTLRELCALMAEIETLPLMAVNPGVADPDDWARVAYKGGSEPGVLNLTTWLEHDGTAYCVSVTQNDTSALDEARLFGLYSGLLQALLAEAG